MVFLDVGLDHCDSWEWWSSRSGCGADGSPGPVPGGLQGPAGGGRERPVGQGGQHGADPKARVLPPGGHIAQLPHPQPAGMLGHGHLDQHPVLGAGSTAGRGLVGQRVPHAIGHPLAPDPLDRLDHMDVMANDEVDLGGGQQPPGHLAWNGVGVDWYSWPQCNSTTTNRAPAARAARASARMRRGSIVLTSQGRSGGSRPRLSP
jgi:hypothetical protein